MLNFGYALPAREGVAVLRGAGARTVRGNGMVRSQGTNSTCCRLFDAAAVTTEILEPLGPRRSNVAMDSGCACSFGTADAGCCRVPAGIPATKTLSLNSAPLKLEDQLRICLTKAKQASTT